MRTDSTVVSSYFLCDFITLTLKCDSAIIKKEDTLWGYKEMMK